MRIEVLGAIFFILLLTALILPFLFKRKKKEYTEKTPAKEINNGKPCPLCGSQLKQGERIHSRMIENKGDLLMYIYGCPYCYPKHPRYKGGSESPEKFCPRCKRKVENNDHLIARVFEKPEKTHVHVLGCQICRKEY